jgi:hypothetical protein
MQTIAQDECACTLCGARFSDSLAWAAHRPWKSRTSRDRCRWPRALYNSAGAWTLRPSAVAEIKRIEEGAADAWKARPATTVATPAQKTPRARLAHNTHSNGAASSGSLVAIRTSEAAA